MVHQFDTEIAAKYGINAAILLNNIAFWIAKNEANKENFHDGKYWTYNSISAFNILFPYLTSRQIQLAIEKLCAEDIVIKGNYNKDKYDHTSWYALTEKGKSILHPCQIDLTPTLNRFNADVEPIPDINTNINTDNIPAPDAPSAESTKEEVPPAFGEPLFFDGPEPDSKPRTGLFTDGFDDFWAAYPKHKSKEAAMRAWSRLRPSEKTQATIKAAVNKAKTSFDWTKDHGTYIPYPATYLNQRRWEDEEPQAESRFKFVD